jgi:putative tryptophan/tyrosine transport system substrate-binding protein
MRKNVIRLALSGMLFAPCLFADAQQSTKLPRIAYVTASSAYMQARRFEVFRQGLRDLGYVEGKNILIEYRFADGKIDRLHSLAAELVDLKVNVIVTAGPSVTGPVKQATSTIPIVMAQDTDPVGNGFVASLARPGGNITGLSSYSAELNGKRLELLKEIIPRLSRVAVLGMSSNPGNSQALKDTELAAEQFGVKVQYFEIRHPKDIETALQTASKGRAEAVIVFNAPSHIQRPIPSLAIKNRLPAIYFNATSVDDGGLMSYGTSIRDLDRRAATYVDKILKGAKPADLPVEQPTKFELVINLKTAKQIDLTIPPNVLARADKVIR